MNSINFLGAFGAGALSFLSPCILPLLPPYLSFITGYSLENTEKHSRFQALSGAFFFGLGFSLVFIALGAAATSVGNFLQYHQYIISRVLGVLVLVFGLHLLGILKIPLLHREKKIHLKLDKKPKYRLLQAFLIGFAFAFGWTPCIGPILGTILTMAMHQESVSHGIFLLTAYSLGLWLPFFIAALFTVPVLGFLSKRPKIALRAGQIAGVMLIITGILLITGQMLKLSALLA